MKAVGYTRVSTSEQAQDGVSLANQRKRIKAFCVAKDWELQAVYEDAGRSGKDLKRAGIQQLITGVKDSKFDIVVIYKLDRLTRSVKDLGYLIELFDKHGIAFSSVSDNFDTTTANGRLVLNILGSVAQWERDIIVERTREALKYKKELGDYLGTVPLGFAIVDGELQEKDDELAIVKKLKKLRTGGYSLGKIAETLNGEGIPTKRDRKWHKSTIRYILNNALYDGVE